MCAARPPAWQLPQKLIDSRLAEREAAFDSARSNADEILKKRTNFAQRQVGQCPARECISYISRARLCMNSRLRECCAIPVKVPDNDCFVRQILKIIREF